MKFGQLHLFERPAGRSEQQIIDEQLDIMLRAEDHGLGCVELLASKVIPQLRGMGVAK